MKRITLLAFVVCSFMAFGAMVNPVYHKSVSIGGGPTDADGGAQIESNGDLTTSGTVTADTVHATTLESDGVDGDFDVGGTLSVGGGFEGESAGATLTNDGILSVNGVINAYGGAVFGDTVNFNSLTYFNSSTYADHGSFSIRNNPPATAGYGTALYVESATADPTYENVGGGRVQSPALFLIGERGTIAARTQSKNGDIVGGIISQGYNGSGGYYNLSRITTYATADVVDHAIGSKMVFKVDGVDGTHELVSCLELGDTGYGHAYLPQGAASAGNLSIEQDDVISNFGMTTHFASATPNTIWATASRGSASIPTQTLLGDQVIKILASAADNGGTTSYHKIGYISIDAKENITTTTTAGAITLATTIPGTTNTPVTVSTFDYAYSAELGNTATQKLGVNDTNRGELDVYGNGGDTGGEMRIHNGATDDGTVDYWQFLANTDLSIGVPAAPVIQLRAADNALLLPSTLALTTSDAANLVIGVDGSIKRSTSGEQFKENIEEYTDVWAALELVPITYVNRQDGSPHIGFSAQQVADVDERLITRDANGEPDSVAYDHVTALLVATVKEQQRMIEELNARLANLENRTPQLGFCSATTSEATE